VLTPDSGAPTVFTAQIDNRPVGDVLPVNGGVRPITSTVVSVPVVFPVNTPVTITVGIQATISSNREPSVRKRRRRDVW